MTKIKSLGGQGLRDMFSTATSWLEKSSADIDALNVFPVPDGDTGTNMLLTMRSTVEESYRAPDRSASAVAQAMAKGALMGARGNSGVILSQIWRGLAQGLAGKESFVAEDLADALEQSSVLAYKGMSNPVEGTILTVIKEVAVAAREHVSGSKSDLISVMTVVVNTASESVANTPRLLQVLRDAGVVDAGGQGLFTVLEGALRHLRGETEEMRFRKSQIIVSDLPLGTRLPQAIGAEEVPFGYCTEFLLKGEKLDTDDIRKKLDKKGESLIVVGDESSARIHIHTLDPGSVIHYSSGLGTMHQVSIRNMDEQHQDYLDMQEEKTLALDTAVIAVVSGDGLIDVVTSLGTSAVVPGGQTMNPSTRDILDVLEAVGAEKVIVLPNNKNIIMAAKQAQELTNKTIEVIPTETIPQGIAALLAFDYEADVQTNAQIMGKALSSVRTIEVTRAVRSTQLGGLKINKKQPIGILDGELVAVGDNYTDAIKKVFARLDLEKAEIVTIYYGDGATLSDTEQVSENLLELYSELEFEMVYGGQPHFRYIISIE